MDYSKAFEWWLKAAKQGNESAQFNIGKMYENGDGVEQNFTKAVEWYSKAAEQGDGFAQHYLGEAYFYGFNVAKDNAKALYWLKKAADNDYSRAFGILALVYDDMELYSEALKWFLKAIETESDGTEEYFVGYYYENGLGTTSDYQKAFSWYKKAADKEYPAGMASIGFFYEMGIVVEKDEKKAFSLYKRAAEKGAPIGQARLAMAYYEGMGTQKNNDLALYWMRKATENGGEEAVELLATLKELIAYEKKYGVQQPYVTNGNTITIIMDKRNSIYYVPCKINGEKADFVFDTGAGLISLSSDFAERLKNLGLLTDEDFLGYGTSMIADGSTHNVLVVNIRDVEIGGLHLYNVRASIKDQQNAPLLLGQSAIEKLGRVTIDGHKLIIHKD